jgi:hypothetical protein
MSWELGICHLFCYLAHSFTSESQQQVGIGIPCVMIAIALGVKVQRTDTARTKARKRYSLRDIATAHYVSISGSPEQRKLFIPFRHCEPPF